MASCWQVGRNSKKATQKACKIFIDLEVHLSSIFHRFWLGFGRILEPSWLPKSIKNWIKMLTKFLLEFWSVLERFLLNFASKLEGRETKKLWFSLGFLAFLLFRPTCQQEAIWSIFYSTWPSTWHWKSTKNPPKSLPESIKIQSKITYKIWSLFL